MDTIVALSTPEGHGLRATLRLSGPECQSLLEQLFDGSDLDFSSTFRTWAGHFRIESQSLPVTVAWMRGPRTYTREDMAEIYLLSAPPQIRQVLQACLSSGARLAQPGEFTRRAFLHGRMDLTQAEGVLELIHSHDAEECRGGMSLLQGGLSDRVADIRKGIVEVLALLEASLDFEEGETGEVPQSLLLARLGKVREKLQASLQWEARRPGPGTEIGVFLAGLPNAGKSSLVNALDPDAKIIVSPISGSTRDCLVGRWESGGHTFRLIDAAGHQEGGNDLTRKAQELAGHFRQTADFVLLVVDGSADRFPAHLVGDREVHLVVFNKADLEPGTARSHDSGIPSVEVSARTGKGLDELRQALVRWVGEGELRRQGSKLSISARHQEALQTALNQVKESEGALPLGGDLAAGSLRQALEALDTITGKTTNEDILDEIFARFCLGK